VWAAKEAEKLELRRLERKFTVRMLGRVDVTRPEKVSLIVVSCHRTACAHHSQTAPSINHANHMAKDVEKRKLRRLHKMIYCSAFWAN